MNCLILLSALTVGQCDAGCCDVEGAGIRVRVAVRKVVDRVAAPVKRGVRFFRTRKPLRNRLGTRLVLRRGVFGRRHR
jgi:hypothetical protein